MIFTPYFPGHPPAKPVPRHFRLAIFARVVLLPLLLSLGTIVSLGSYYETNDEGTLTWLFSGVLALKPVPSVPLYLHGYGHLLAAAYTVLPKVPWLGLLLAGLLGGATVLLFAVLDRLLRPYLRAVPLALVLVLFFGMAWAEHWLWFSHARVGLLLAGAAVLYAAQRWRSRRALLLGLAGLGAAWLLRPSVAVLGFGAVLPAALLLAGSWRRAAPVLLGGGLLLALATGAAAVFRTPAEARTQAQDGYFARILDFDQLQPAPRTPADSLATAAIGSWLLGDSTVVNEALGRRAYRFDAADFWGRTVPAKVALRAGMLVRDSFPLLLALAATAVVLRRRTIRHQWFWPVQLSFGGLLMLFAGVLKLPPRIAQPLLLFWLLTNLALLLATPVAGFIRRRGPRWNPLLVAIAALAGLLYGAKTLHRRQVLGQERSRHERALAEISQRTGGRIRVLAGTSDLLKSLSPFRVYTVGTGSVLLLSGWSAHDPSQPALWQALVGTRDQATCLRRLAAPGRQVQWLLSAETARWLNRRLRYRPGTEARVVLEPGPVLAADTTLRFYRPAQLRR